ncbi:MAG: GTP 3',8-cyclase MoaA [Oscillospiraceae bacterium]|nr:GTP 3',8-cyclase MoaA [Oscillospiraceae bacterium]
MWDAHNRRIDYARVSITDRCNLRCLYCMPGDIPFIPHNDILRYEEILRVCATLAKLGVKTVRVTGGEPLVRKGCPDFLKELKKVPGVKHIALSTNAALLEPHIETLSKLELDSLNISVDSLDPETYARITGRDALSAVLGSLNAAIKAGLRVKVNFVPLRGLNDNEILPIARLAEANPVDARYIELMPSDAGNCVKGVTSDEVLAILANEYPDLKSDNSPRGFGPARYFVSARLRGAIGIIDAVSNRFCSSCNRLRLTSTGFLKLCLFHGDGLDLRQMLRGGASDDDIESRIEEAVYNKPESRQAQGGSNPESRIGRMSQIGG